MRLLLDTNVLIALEDAQHPFAAAVAPLSRLAQKHSLTLTLHDRTLDDFERDSDDDRRMRSLWSTTKYPKIDQPPSATDQFIGASGGVSSDNDRVDVDLLYAIDQNCADALVTEDRRLRSRAERVGLDEQVYFIEQAVEWLTTLYGEHDAPPLPQVEDVSLHNIDLANSFFDSLREGYTGFDEWFERVARRGRRAWIVRADDQIDAICIYHLEEPEGARSFKLCTLKVGENSRGRHLGELLLHRAFDYCTKNECNDTFVEVQAEQEFLVGFLREFGFAPDGHKDNAPAELVYRKRFRPLPDTLVGDALAYHIAWAPAYATSGVKKFCIPIEPGYHGRLFPDAPAIPAAPDQTMLDLTAYAAASAEGNGIRKAYLSHSGITRVGVGDLVLFYRSHDASAITTLGIVEKVERFQQGEAAKLAAFVGKRTVYSLQEIEVLAAKSVLAILFRQIEHLQVPVPLSKWQELGGTAPQSITSVSDDQFDRIMELSRADPH